jgi:hypothetical protein
MTRKLGGPGRDKSWLVTAGLYALAAAGALAGLWCAAYLRLIHRHHGAPR